MMGDFLAEDSDGSVECTLFRIQRRKKRVEINNRPRETDLKQQHRYIIRGDGHEIVLEDVAAAVVIARISNVDELVEGITTTNSEAWVAEAWVESISNLLVNTSYLRTENQQLSADLALSQTDLKNSKQQVKALNKSVKLHEENHKNAQANTSRLRLLRDQYRQEAKELYNENRELQAKTAATAVGLSERNQISTYIRGHTGLYKIYPDVVNFYGVDDIEYWEAWKSHLDAKFHHSAILFPCEQDKIDYIRDHCKSTALKRIKARAHPGSDDPYTSSMEAIQDLESMLSESKKVAKLKARLYSQNFGMGKVNPTESFDQFLVRFTVAIVPLGFSDQDKIEALEDTISDRLRFEIADDITYTSFSQFVSRCRQCDIDLPEADGLNNRPDGNPLSPTKGSGSDSRTPKPQHASTSSNDGAMSPGRCPPHVAAGPSKEVRYFRYLETSQQAQDEDASCRNKSRLTDGQVALQLKAEEILDSKRDKGKTDPITGKKGCLMYSIRFRGMENYNTRPDWQIWADAIGCPYLVADFHHKYPHKAGPHFTFITPDDWTPTLNTSKSSVS